MAGKKSVLEATELAFTAHFDLAAIHPFYDGNGRTSRLMMNYVQAYFNLPLAIVHKEDRLEYFQALTDSRTQEDISVFQNFMKGQYQKQLMAETIEYQKMQETKELIPRTGKGRGRSLFF